MEYRAVGKRCAVDLNDLKLPISNQRALAILIQKGFCPVSVDIVGLARQCLGKTYRRGASIALAPDIFDCSSLIKWLYAQKGVWLPRRSIQQRKLGRFVRLELIKPGDVIFTTGRINYFDEDPSENVGHVGIYTGDGIVIHAANKESGVIESPLENFIGEDSFRGAREYIPDSEDVFIFESPPDRDVEISDDFRWIVLQNLPK